MEEQNNQKSNSVLNLITVIADIFWFFTAISFWGCVFILPILLIVQIVWPGTVGCYYWREPLASNAVRQMNWAIEGVYALFAYFYVFFARKHISAKPHLKYVYMWAFVALISYLGGYVYEWEHKAILDKIRISRIDVTLVDANSGHVLPLSVSSGEDIKGFTLIDSSFIGVDINTIELLYGSIGSVKFTFDSTGYKSKKVTFEPGTQEHIKVSLDPNTSSGTINSHL